MGQLMGGTCGEMGWKGRLKRRGPHLPVILLAGPHYKRLTFLLVFSISEGHAYSFGNRRFLHLFPTMELPLIGLPRTGVTLSLMAIRFA